MIPRTNTLSCYAGSPFGAQRRKWNAVPPGIWERRWPVVQQAATAAPAADTDASLRLAFGIFYEPARLARALAELIAAGANPQDLCLVGPAAAFDRILRGAAGGEALDQLLAGCRLHDLGRLMDGCELRASTGTLLRTLLRRGKWSKNGGATVSNWLWPELSARLSEHVRQGGLALIVATPALGEEYTYSRVLLGHLANAVQTHQFRAVA